jgi:hypothetical protein
MDLRFATFDLVFRSVVLRPLLVNYADRVEHGHAPEGVPASTCFVRLRWAVDMSAPTPPGTELLAAEAHMPRHGEADDVYLDFVLQRVRAALTGQEAAALITARWLQTSREVMESDVGTIFKASTFEITAASATQHHGAALVTWAPWTGWAEPGVAAPPTPIIGAADMN